MNLRPRMRELARINALRAQHGYSPVTRHELRSISYSDLWGKAKDAAVTTPQAMDHTLRLSSVYSAVGLIAGLISSFPLESMRAQGGTSVISDKPIALVDDPSMFGGTVDWVHRMVVSMALRGNAFGYITQVDKFGYPRQIEWLHPDEVAIRSDRSVAAPQWFWLGRPVDNSMFVHVPLFTIPGRILGASPIQFALGPAVEQGLLAHAFGRDYFQNGAVPAGIITSDGRVRDEDAEAIRARFKKSAAGRDVAVLGLGLSYKAISVPPEESQFLETIRASATEVANIFHLPPSLVGGDSGDSMTYSNIESQHIQIARLALSPFVTRIEKMIFRYTPRPQSARFNMDEFLRADTLSRYQAYATALGGNGGVQWLGVDEVRAKERLAPRTFIQIAPAPAPGDQGANVGGDSDGLGNQNPGTSNPLPKPVSAPLNDTPPYGGSGDNPPPSPNQGKNYPSTNPGMVSSGS